MCIFKCCKYCEDEGHRHRLVSHCLVDIYSETLELFDWVVMAGNGSVRILLVWWLQRPSITVQSTTRFYVKAT